ncbi:proline iminopeptidase [Lophiotrema nucula]|uniref:Proline iminopeptidase n=1 Tax=Lophiotrema nucula TaxID=690887 RepID=A0A6A5Z720_9PLEO|nr:proline iminopeptidase [Lophiotrema nucula]
MTSEKGYEHTEAFDSGDLQVSDLHRIHYAQHGKPDGLPVIFLHGGPGGIGVAHSNLIFFDPAIYRVVLFDQRGCGQSEPSAECRENTTQLLVQDIETLRKHVGIEKWHMVFGGSWGSTLALAYAQTHPQVCGSLVLRGVFLATKEELQLTSDGSYTGRIWPEEYDRFMGYLPGSKRADPSRAYHELIHGDDKAKAREAAREWDRFSGFGPEQLKNERYVMAYAKITTHYFVNDSFLEPDQLLKGCEKIKHIPISIVHGRHDFICPPRVAWSVHKALPGSKLYWSETASHSQNEPENLKNLIKVCNDYAKEDFHLR